MHTDMNLMSCLEYAVKSLKVCRADGACVCWGLYNTVYTEREDAWRTRALAAAAAEAGGLSFCAPVRPVSVTRHQL